MSEACLHSEEPAHPAKPVLLGQAPRTDPTQAHDASPLDALSHGEAKGHGRTQRPVQEAN